MSIRYIPCQNCGKMLPQDWRWYVCNRCGFQVFATSTLARFLFNDRDGLRHFLSSVSPDSFHFSNRNWQKTKMPPPINWIRKIEISPFVAVAKLV